MAHVTQDPASVQPAASVPAMGTPPPRPSLLDRSVQPRLGGSGAGRNTHRRGSEDSAAGHDVVRPLRPHQIVRIARVLTSEEVTPFVRDEVAVLLVRRRGPVVAVEPDAAASDLRPS